MRYKQIPKSHCEVPSYYQGAIIIAEFDANLRARNAEILRRIKARLFLKQNQKHIINTTNLNAALTAVGEFL